MIGWHEMGQSTELPAGTVGQYWNYTEPETPETAEHALSFVEQGGKLIMSPANVAYLDMKYDIMTQQGLTWAQGFTDVEEAYSWDPADVLPGVGDEQLLGVEAPLWSETLETIDDIEFMAFPRIAAVAELAWSPRGEKDFAEFAPRLADARRQARRPRHRLPPRRRSALARTELSPDAPRRVGDRSRR